ncbi:MAG TPA: alpha/beta hydrolase [Caulobacteraceae bacterium]|nr:alpha/beta hydrolase [Caulobacteraceae bacterium]
MTLDRGAQRFLRMLSASAGDGGRRNAADRRRSLEALAALAEETPPDPVDVRDLLSPGEHGGVRLHLYRPAELRGDGCLVFFHGGGWVAGGLATHDGVCRRLAAAGGMRVLAVDYRLAPEHPFPAAVEDALAVVRWAADEADALGFDARRLAVGGDSAGAGLAAVVTQTRERPPIAAQLLVCPILDVTNQSASRHAFAHGYFLDAATLEADLADYCGAGVDRADPRISPALAPTLEGQPTTLIHAAEYDPFRDEAIAYAGRLTAAGVDTRLTVWPGLIHYFYALPRLIPAALPALSAIGEELAAALA